MQNKQIESTMNLSVVGPDGERPHDAGQELELQQPVVIGTVRRVVVSDGPGGVDDEAQIHLGRTPGLCKHQGHAEAKAASV